MKNLMIGIGALAMASVFTVGIVGPAAAQDGRDRPGIQHNGHGGNTPHVNNSADRRGNFAYYNNHRGSSYRRRGYGYYDGFWFPPAAFIGGLIGGAIASQGNDTTSHVEWCEQQYRSYRPSDDTFQPYNGPRQLCVSPYG